MIAFIRTVPFKLWRKLWRKIGWISDNIASLPAFLAWTLSESNLVEQNILRPRYRNTRAAFSASLPPLAGVAKNIVEALEEHGIYITTLDQLGVSGTDALLEDSTTLAQRLKVRAQASAFSDRHEVHASLAEFRQVPEIFRWGLDDRLLQIVRHYLGLPVGYDGVSCVLSVADQREIGARAWHRDLEDRRMLKICVYLNEVDAEGGPLECVAPELNAWLSKSPLHQREPISNQEMQQLPVYGAAQTVSCTGPKGTVIFLDTARFFHRGKPPTQNNRAAVFFHYFSSRPSRPFFCHRTPFCQQDLGDVVANLSPEQQACVRWEQNLPLLARLIPRKRI